MPRRRRGSVGDRQKAEEEGQGEAAMTEWPDIDCLSMTTHAPPSHVPELEGPKSRLPTNASLLHECLIRGHLLSTQARPCPLELTGD